MIVSSLFSDMYRGKFKELWVETGRHRREEKESKENKGG